MHKVLIMSDSHGLTEEIMKIKERHPFEFIIHCGDSELAFDAPELQGVTKVGGNCDFDPHFPTEQILTVAGLRFFVTHGHLYQVKRDLSSLSYRAEETKSNIICFGHTHIAGAGQIGKQLLINPGSIRLPRNRIEKTYAIMKWESSDSIAVTFHTLDGDIVEEMTYHANLNR